MPGFSQHRRPVPPHPFHRPGAVEARYTPIGKANVLSASLPNLIFTAGVGGISGGVAYERFLNKGGYLSFALPAYAYVGQTIRLGESRTGYRSSKASGVIVTPAFMFHAAGNKQKVDFSLGPGLIAGNMHLRKTRYKIIGAQGFDRVTSEINKFIGGLLGELNLAVHSSTPYVFSVHAGAGFVTDGEDITTGLLQIGIKMGGRF